MKKIPWNIIWQKGVRIPSFVAEHAFPVLLFLIGLAGVFSLLLFYVYGFSIQTKRVEQAESLYNVKEDRFLEVLGGLEERERNLQNIVGESFRDIFNSAELTEE